MTFECTKSKCDDGGIHSSENPIIYVLGNKMDGFTVVDVNMDAGVVTLRNPDMSFEKTGLPKNFKWRD